MVLLYDASLTHLVHDPRTTLNLRKPEQETLNVVGWFLQEKKLHDAEYSAEGQQNRDFFTGQVRQVHLVRYIPVDNESNHEIVRQFWGRRIRR